MTENSGWDEKKGAMMPTKTVTSRKVEKLIFDANG
jgi:hypothetical protein